MAFNLDAIYKNRPRLHTALAGAILAACMIFFMPGASLSIDVLETVRFEDRWPDASVDNLAYNAADNLLYLAAGNFLVILNAADLTEQSRLKVEFPDDSDPNDIELSRGIIGIAADPVDDYVYLACGPQGIAIVDVSDPDNPFIESTLAEASQDDPIYASSVDYDPDAQRLYVADVFHGLRCIINVNDPNEDPSQEWAYEQRTDWQDEDEEASGGHINVHIKSIGADTFAFVLDQLYGLRIFDVAGGAGPSDPLASFDMRSRSYWGQYSEVVDVVADGDSEHAYVSDSSYGVTILDFSGIPENEITNVGQIATPGSASGVALSDDTDNNNTLFVADGNRGMLVADVTDPEAAINDGTDSLDFPEELVEAETYAATGAYAVLAANGAQEVFLASGKEGLAKLGEVPPQYEKTYDYNPPSRITGLYVDAEYAYILDDSGPEEGLRIVYLRDEETDRSRLDGFIATGGTANAVAVYEPYAYVADGLGGVAVIDITDKTNPQDAVGSGPGTVGDARDIKIYEDADSAYAYIADYSGELVIARVDETTGGLTETGSSSTVSNAVAVAVYEQEDEDQTFRYAAVVNGSTLTMFDVTDPGSPSSIRSLATSESRDVAVVNLYGKQFAVVADGANGIRLIDISDPTNPNQIDSFATNEPAEAVSLYEAYIHAAVGDSGIAVLGIEDKDPPELIGIDLDSEDAVNPYYNTPGHSGDVFLKKTGKRYTYVADNYGGFLALVHEDRYGDGINEQPFPDSPDDSRRIECFISSLFE